jgi:exodeoxyribonuclease VIII
MNDAPTHDVLARPVGPRVDYDMPAELYHAIEALSASGARSILRSPAHFRVWRDEPREPTPAMQLGTAVHLAVLEPERFESSVVVAPEFNRRTKDGKAAAEAFAAEHAGKLILDAEQHVVCLRARDAVAGHAGARSLLAGGRNEVSLFWTDGQYGVPCKCRIDHLRDDGGIVDVKTTTDASPDAFGRSVAEWLYHVQGWFNCSGAEHVLNRTPAFFAFVAVEKEAPFGVACYVLEHAHLLAGAHLGDEALRRYRHAIDTGTWEGYPQTIQPARLPQWALRFRN